MIRGLRWSLPSDKCVCTNKFIDCCSKRDACKDIACILSATKNILSPEARILIIEILAFFFQNETMHGHGFAKKQRKKQTKKRSFILF